MSTDFRLEKRVLMQELFDGRLQQFGIAEKNVRSKTPDDARVLSDGRGNYLWVWGTDNGRVGSLTRYGKNSALRILQAIEAAFDTEVYTEDEPQFYGCNTEEELCEWRAEMSREIRNGFYENIIKFVTGKEHELMPGTIGMVRGEIAKTLVFANADLLLPQNKDKFLRVIDEVYEQENPPETFDEFLRETNEDCKRDNPLLTPELDDKDLTSAELSTADLDDLAREPNLRPYDYLVALRGK